MATFPKRLGTPSTEYAAFGIDRREHTLKTDADGIARPHDHGEAAVADTHRLPMVTEPDKGTKKATPADAGDGDKGGQ